MSIFENKNIITKSKKSKKKPKRNKFTSALLSKAWDRSLMRLGNKKTKKTGKVKKKNNCTFRQQFISKSKKH